MRQYRYRTAVLIGPWRESHDEAIGDAASAGQLVVEANSGDVRWIVPGRIEEKARRRQSRAQSA